MKILHMADLHLDSRMETNLSAEKAKERKHEMLLTFRRCVEFGAKNGIRNILIAGDIFDRKAISKSVVEAVRSIITQNEEIMFYCLKGNHDDGDTLKNLAANTSNIRLFDEGWSSFCLDKEGKVVLTAADTMKQDEGLFDSLFLDKDKINIVMLHGQIMTGKSERNVLSIPLGRLKDHYIDYLALGHVHRYSTGKIDERGIYVYSGCMESRGFDEGEDHGVVIVDINTEDGSIQQRLYSLEERSVVKLDVDISGCSNTIEMEREIETAFDKVGRKNLVEVRLTGEISVDTYLDIGYLLKAFEDRFYLLKMKNHTRLRIDVESYIKEVSLRGEFVRKVYEDDSLSQEEKHQIINMGIKALRGEDVSYEDYGN